VLNFLGYDFISTTNLEFNKNSTGDCIYKRPIRGIYKINNGQKCVEVILIAAFQQKIEFLKKIEF
jgi:hypothetical protein